MFKALTPILAILVAIGLLVTHVHPSFISIKSMERETDEYENALKQADELRARIDARLEQRRGFDQTSLVRLSQLLPTKVDEIGIILTLDTLAKEHDMTFSDIEVSEAAVEAEAEEEMPVEEFNPENADALPAPEVQAAGGLSYTDITFTVGGTYEEFKDLMHDLERSLTLFEVMELTFMAVEAEGAGEEKVDHKVTLRTFAHTARTE